MSPSAGGRRGRSVYYEMQSSIMFLMPPFLLRAFTLGVLWPSLGRLLLVNVQVRAPLGGGGVLRRLGSLPICVRHMRSSLAFL
eukprot:scaffold2398_cov139-Isochrysis_galbana.AAC.2